MATLWILVTLGACLAHTIAPRQSTATNCNTAYFSSIIPSGLLIERVQHVTTGFFTPESGNIGYPTIPTGLPDLCAVIVHNTTADYRFGLFLPDKWNDTLSSSSSAQRFLAIGSYAFLGGINWLDMGVGVKYGAVTLSTDTGHSSGAGDITWAGINATRRQTNWAHEALRGSVLAGRKLTETYYGRQATRAYFSGCSTGGRQGLKFAQQDPNSFDGVLVGAPAWDTKHLMPWIARNAAQNLPESATRSINDVGLFARLGAEVLRQCDGLDGVADGIVSAPDACRSSFDITQVRCDNTANKNKTGCWTAAQINTALLMYADYSVADGGKQKLVYKGAEYGSELEWATYLLPAPTGTTDAQSNVRRNFDAQYPRYFIGYGSGWQTTSYNDSVVRDAEARDAAVVRASADQFDLGAFRGKGGKILMYGGLADNVVPVRHTTYYYESAVTATGGADDFFRYFQIPGMKHCWGTPDDVKAPWMIAGAGQAVQRPPYASAWSVPLGFRDARHDALLALFSWVESGSAPDRIIASEFNFTDTAHQNIVLHRQRPLCVYPKTARWDGKGNKNMADSWSCG